MIQYWRLRWVSVSAITESVILRQISASCDTLGWVLRNNIEVTGTTVMATMSDTNTAKAMFEFGHDFNGIVCRRKDIEALNPHADPMLARYARRLVEADLANAAPGMAAQVRQLVVSLLGTEHCTIDVAAQHLGVNRRTIHRRLSDEGQTFSRIVDAVRRELAVRYVADKRRSLAEVSSLLGFSAPSGFSRWYRRHFSAAPSARRARAAR